MCVCAAFSERAVEYVICFHCELFAYGRILIAFKVHCPYAKIHENKRTIFEIDIFWRGRRYKLSVYYEPLPYIIMLPLSSLSVRPTNLYIY